MKPRILFTLIFATLIGGSVASRYAVAGDVRQGEIVCGGDASGALAALEAVQNEPTPVTRINGAYAFGSGELPALRRLAQALDEDVTTEGPVGVSWKETYRHRVVSLRVYYLPREQTLLCTTGAHGAYAYWPVTRAGIDAALRDGRKAPFASANLYSLPGTSPP